MFGPRGSGRTTWFKSLYIDPLDIKTFDDLMLEPHRFEALINSPENRKKRVVVDEVQKFPRILAEEFVY